jgi:glycosyltransferase involved in cell wall biosynthesis
MIRGPKKSGRSKLKMKILVISHQLDYSGGPRALLAASKAFRKLGHAVSLASFKAGPMAEEFRSAGVQIESELKINQFDVVILNTIIGAQFATKLPSETRYILWLHESPDLFCHTDLIFGALRAAENAASIIFPSQACKSLWMRFGVIGRRESICIRSPIELPDDYLSASPRPFSPSFRLVSIDPDEPFRGYRLISAVVDKLLRDGLDLHWSGVGAKFSVETEKLAREYPDRIKMLGRVARNDCLEILRASDLYVSATAYATQNLGLCEAACVGVPALVSNIPAHIELQQCIPQIKTYPLYDARYLERNIRDIVANRVAFTRSAVEGAACAKAYLSADKFAKSWEKALS